MMARRDKDNAISYEKSNSEAKQITKSKSTSKENLVLFIMSFFRL